MSTSHRDFADAERPSLGRETLAASERLAALIENAPVTLFVLDRDGVFIQVEGHSDAVSNTFRAALIGQSAFDVYKGQPAGLDCVRRALAGSAGGAIVEGQTQMFDVRLSPVTSPDGSRAGAIGVATDVTERETAYRALQLSEARREFAASTVTDGTWETDLFTAQVTLSARWRVALGYDANEVDDPSLHSMQALIHPDDWMDAAEAALNALQSGATGYAVEIRMRRKDGEYRWIACRVHIVRDADGTPTRLIGSNIDVHERHVVEEELIRSKQALSASETRFRQLIERAPDAVFVHRSGQLLYCNPALRALFGVDENATIAGLPIHEFIHPDDRERWAGLEASASVERVPDTREIRFVSRGGRSTVAEIIELEIDFDGAPSTLVFARDVTERREIQAKLFQADRLASVGTLAAGVAHEINNPLAYVVANIELTSTEIREILDAIDEAQRRLAEPDCAAAVNATLADVRTRLAAIAHGIDDARDGADRVRSVIRDIKSFSRMSDEQIGVIDPCRAINSSLNLAASEVRPRARLVREFGSVPLIEANESRLGQVVLNLVVNAAHAIGEGNPEGNEIRIVTRTDDRGRAVIEIRDTGAGIDPENLSRIFDPFFTTKPLGAGTGLGLSVCHALVTAMHGEITVQSVLGRGTTFQIALPAAIAPTTVVPATPRPPSGRPASRGRVLVVDDEASIASIIRRVLARDHDVVTESNGRAALDRIRAGERFDVIFCDLMMPGMNGMELHATLAIEAPDVADAMVFITGGAFTPLARTFVDCTANTCLEKPFEVARLRALIRARMAVAIEHDGGPAEAMAPHRSG